MTIALENAELNLNTPLSSFKLLGNSSSICADVGTSLHLRKLSKIKIAAQFSDASQDYDQYAVVQKQIAKVNLSLIQQSKSEKCNISMDLGCGTGAHTFSVAAMSKRCLALDISHGMLETAKTNLNNENSEQGANVHFTAGDAESLPIKSNSIDLLHSSMALQWCSSPTKAIQEVTRVLSKEGTAQLAIMLDSSLMELKKAWLSMGIESRVNQFFSAQQWLDALENACQISADFTLSVKQHIHQFKEWHPSSLHMLRALKRIGAATKTGVDSAGFHGQASDTGSIKRAELKELDRHMREHALMLESEHNSEKAIESRTKTNENVRLPLSYDILFLTIKKSQK